VQENWGVETSVFPMVNCRFARGVRLDPARPGRVHVPPYGSLDLRLSVLPGAPRTGAAVCHPALFGEASGAEAARWAAYNIRQPKPSHVYIFDNRLPARRVADPVRLADVGAARHLEV
jgi:hypothetical protein